MTTNKINSDSIISLALANDCSQAYINHECDDINTGEDFYIPIIVAYEHGVAALECSDDVYIINSPDIDSLVVTDMNLALHIISFYMEM